MGRRKTYRSELRAVAVEQHGYVTVDDTVRLGIPDDMLDRLLRSGDLIGLDDGLFRLDAVPTSRRHKLAEAVLRVGPDAYLSHDAVLALHDLADHRPDRVRVGTPRPVPSARRPEHWPHGVEVLHRALPATELTRYGGIRSATVARALLDCRTLLPVRVLADAADRAAELGLLLRRERHEVLAALDAG
jgi:predicted transcriptional regulator of viral defense system